MWLKKAPLLINVAEKIHCPRNSVESPILNLNRIYKNGLRTT
jgi:hypothetical protein